MKTRALIISVAAAVMSLAACERSMHLNIEPGEAGASLSVRSARIAEQAHVLVKTSETACPIPVLEDKQNGINLSVSASVSPISSENQKTKAAETTTANLDMFTVDGYLGDEILTCRGASQADKDNRHFMEGASAQKNTDGYWYFSQEYRWRSNVNHHFWAYNGTPGDFSVDADGFDRASFTYENSGEEDLVIAYGSQFWVDETDGNDNYPIQDLTFKHALSEISVDHSQIIFKQFSVTGGQEISPSTRCSISRVKMVTSSRGDCVASAGSFAWECYTDDTDYLAIECTAPGNTTFTIPQIPSNTMTVLYIYDSWRGQTTPVFVKFPASGSAPALWQSGYRYTYTLTGTVCAPYYTNLGYIDPGFSGKSFQKFAVMNNLLSQYVRKVEITWKGLPECKSNDTPIAVVYVPADQEPTSTMFPMNSMSETVSWRNNDNVGFLASAVHQAISTPVRGRITSGSLNDPASCECYAEFIIPDTMTSPISFYLLYDGDNAGNAEWTISSMNIEVSEFKSPVQIL